MTVEDSTRQVPVATPHGLRRIVTASAAGMTLEAYDFLLYGAAAALVFNHLFFPSEDPLIGTMLAFLSYALGFFARPLGGIVFGHFGDRIGRKPLLIVSLVLMGVATFAIGLLPTYASIGAWAAVLLCLLRLIQGFALGGEWGGAMLLVAEHVPGRRRGAWTAVAEAGIPLGNLMATGVLALLALLLTDEAFLSWGWRIPFLLSAVLLVVGFWVRRRVEDAPLFLAARQEAPESRALPVLEVLQRFPRQVLICSAARLTENIVYYVVTAFVIVYVVEHNGGDKAVVLSALVVANLVQIAATPAFGALSDRLGRRPVLLLGAVGTAGWAYAFFALLDTRDTVWIAVAMIGGLVFHSALYGPQAAFFAEQFDTRVRYSGMSLSAQLPTLVGGSIAPFVATALLVAFGTGTAVATYVAIAAVVTTVAVALARETHLRDLSRPFAADAAR
ncbi:MFS transporter [Pseudonocardia sp.]|uniref:MFS transporter n=1 Tax=Pseudonocardia sp. TaxID=60912 RepID=UPI003D13BD1C